MSELHPPDTVPASLDPGLLLARVQGGDREAERELVERFSRGLTLMLRQLTRDPSAADDLHQDTFVVVLAKARRGEIRNPEALGGFIRSTARNLFIADRRKEKRTTELDDSLELPGSGDGLSGELGRLVRDEEAKLVRELLAELRFDRDRQLLIRYYLGDEPSGRICQDLEIDPKRFNRVLFRARGRLRELWQSSASRRRLLSQSSMWWAIIVGTFHLFVSLHL